VPGVKVGDTTALRCPKGNLRVADRCVFGREVTVACHLDVEIGSATLLADWVYVADFDHRYADPTMPIKDQGIVKAPVRIGPDCGLGVRSTVLRGVEVG